MKKRINQLQAIVALPALFAFGTAGCAAEVRTHPAYVTADEDVVVAAEPVNIYAYPHTEYRGETVYYVDGRWYHRNAGRWAYYRQEPPELVHHRRQVQAAPPAPRHYEEPRGHHVEVAPPARREPPPGE